MMKRGIKFVIQEAMTTLNIEKVKKIHDINSVTACENRMTPIIQYILNEKLPSNPKEASMVKTRS